MPGPWSVRSRAACLALAGLLAFPSIASAHTVEICVRDDGGVTTFYAGSYHSPFEAPSPVGQIIVDGFGYPFSGWIYPNQLPADVTCWGYGASAPSVVHYQTFTSAFDAGWHTITFDATTVIQSPWGPFPDMEFGGGACNDADFDSICNDDDLCPLDAANDGDGDGFCANVDNCPLDANPSQTDANFNGTGDVCEGTVCGNGLVTGAEECDDGNIAGGDGCSAICTNEIADADGDGVSDLLDACPGHDDAMDADFDTVPDGCDLCLGDDTSGDTDDDGRCDTNDNCPVDTNNDQADTDADGIGNVCEADTDIDGVIDDLDNCATHFNADQADNDADGAGDVCDPDDDEDGWSDVVDNCPILPNDQTDSDNDAAGDDCDGDDDGDGVADESDLCWLTPIGVPYDDDGCSGTQRVAYECDATAAWADHGAYVSCVVHAANAATDAGLLTNREAAAIKRAAAQSSVGQ